MLIALCIAGERVRHVSAVQEEVPGPQPAVRADTPPVHHPCCWKALPLSTLPLPSCSSRSCFPTCEDGAYTKITCPSCSCHSSNTSSSSPRGSSAASSSRRSTTTSFAWSSTTQRLALWECLLCFVLLTTSLIQYVEKQLQLSKDWFHAALWLFEKQSKKQSKRALAGRQDFSELELLMYGRLRPIFYWLICQKYLYLSWTRVVVLPLWDW